MFAKEPYRGDRMSDDQYRILMILAQFKLDEHRINDFIKHDNYITVVYNDIPYVVKFTAVSARSWLEAKYCNGKGHYEIIDYKKEVDAVLNKPIREQCVIKINTTQSWFQKIFNRFDINISYGILMRIFYNVTIHNITRGVTLYL